MQEDNDYIKVLIAASGKNFYALPDASLLESGLASGIALPYRCANGSCGDCRAKILSGKVKKIRFHDYALTESEKLAGICLLCANTALTQLTIEVTEACSPLDIPLQSLRAKVCHVENLPDVAIVRFKLARGKALQYLAGQYATVTTGDGSSVTLAIANCPCEPDYLEFHVPQSFSAKTLESGTETKHDAHTYEHEPNSENARNHDHNKHGHNYIQNQARTKLRWPGNIKPRARVTIEGPHGDFTINQQSEDRNAATPDSVFFIATADGFAAIKPLLEHMMSQDSDTACTLIWIASETISHYQHNLCRSWADAFDNVYYRPLGSIDDFTENAINEWGLIQPGVRIFISGDPGLNRTVHSVLEASGVAETSVQIDSLCQ